MPLYEYYCEPCDRTFETLVRGLGDGARCPQCGSGEVVKQLSVPAAAHSGRSQSGALPVYGEAGGPAYGCGRPECGSGRCAGLE
jgi:putative FmdB family regulatory protein